VAGTRERAAAADTAGEHAVGGVEDLVVGGGTMATVAVGDEERFRREGSGGRVAG
jgi:hypothetical protein